MKGVGATWNRRLNNTIRFTDTSLESYMAQVPETQAVLSYFTVSTSASR